MLHERGAAVIMLEPSAQKTRPDMDEALDQFRELAALSKLYSFDLFIYLRELNDLGTPILRAYVDDTPAKRTDDIIVHYELDDGLKILLTTLRAMNVHAGTIKASSSERAALAIAAKGDS
jgi:hypothetical protein